MKCHNSIFWDNICLSAITSLQPNIRQSYELIAIPIAHMKSGKEVNSKITAKSSVSTVKLYPEEYICNMLRVFYNQDINEFT